jgi:hypothetical protein
MANIDSEAIRNSWNSRRRPSEGVTLVAGYGSAKPQPFSQLLSDLRTCCAAIPDLTGWIEFYNQAQVHATIVGLEGKRSGDSIVQDNIRSRVGGTGPCPSMNIGGFLDFLGGPVSELAIVVGGFQQGAVNPFDRDPCHKPFQRSFDVRADGLLVAMGWPHSESGFMPSLIGLRKYLETFNIVHKYHLRPQDQDNDFFFVIGEVNAERWHTASQPEREATQKSIDRLVAQCRQALSSCQHRISFALRDFQLVNYAHTSLAGNSFSRRASEVDVDTFLRLYDPPA